MNRIEKYNRIESSETPWVLAKRWARFGELAAAQLSIKSSDGSEVEKELALEISTLAKNLVRGVDDKSLETIKTVANEWESADLEQEGLTTCNDIFANERDRLKAFHATQIGQMQAVGYADRELALPIEFASIYRALVEDASDSVDEVYDLDFGFMFEECFYPG